MPRRWRRAGRRAVTGIWIATVAVELTGIVLVAFAHTTLHTSLGFGTVTAELVFGDVLIGAGVGLAMIGGRVANVFLLVVVPVVVIGLLFAAQSGWFGPGVQF